MKINLNGGVAERTQWVERYRASGKGLRRFAQEHGLRATQLHYWTYRCPIRARTTSPAAPVFREVTLPKAWPPTAEWVAEVALPDGSVVRLDRRAEIPWVRSLVESLRRSCSL